MTNNTTIDRPIKGDVSRRSTARVPQEDAASFLAALDNLLAQDGVVSVHWDQYTPYFNDGDPCEFSTGELFVRLDDRFIPEEERVEDEDEWDEEYIEDRPGIVTDYNLRNTDYNAPGRPTRNGSIDPEYSTKYRAGLDANSTFELNGQPTKHIHDALVDINWGAFENVLEDNFGDPASVTATREGFKVEYYSHD